MKKNSAADTLIAVFMCACVLIPLLWIFGIVVSSPFSIIAYAILGGLIYGACKALGWINRTMLDVPWFDKEAWDKMLKEAGEAGKQQADKQRHAQQEKDRAARQTKEQQQQLVERLKKQSWREPALMRVVGRGLPGLQEGAAILVSCISKHIHLSNVATTYDFPISFDDLSKVEVSGAGISTVGGGAMGGGIGLEGAAQGILIASIINLLTTRTVVDTFLTLRFEDYEITLQGVKISPLDLKLALSPAIRTLEGNQKTKSANGSMSEEIDRLSKQFKEGVLSAEEFQRAKAAVINRWS